MYKTTITVERIKAIAKSKGITLKIMLEDCELNKNILSSMQARGSWLQANNLAKIADYLDCSVDYLLGRTDIPDINRSPDFESDKSNESENIIEPAFIVHQYTLSAEDTPELNDYLSRNNISLNPGQAAVSGRACVELKAGDALISECGLRIKIDGLHSYGYAFNSIPAGMTCVVFTNAADIELKPNEALFKNLHSM